MEVFRSHRFLANSFSESRMTLSTAFSVVEKSNKSSRDEMRLLQGHLDKKHLRSGRHALAAGPNGSKAAANQAAGAYNAGAWKALNMLNEMILEATQKMDFEVVRCDGDERTNLEQLKSIREDIIMF